MRQWAAYSVAAQYTAKCVDNYGPEEKPWPNVTLPDFHDQMRGALVLSHGLNIEFSPFFPNNEKIRSEWEAYAVENEVREGFNYHEYYLSTHVKASFRRIGHIYIAHPAHFIILTDTGFDQVCSRMGSKFRRGCC
jgi:hypothetical protein